MKILIIAHDFPPINRVASLRPFSWAKYWKKKGHEICVLTVQAQSFTAPLNLKVDEDVLAGIQVEAIQYLPAKPISSDSLGSEPPQTFMPRVSFAARLYSLARKSLRSLSEFLGTGSFLYASSLWILPAIRRAKLLHQQAPFDVVVSTFGPPASHIIAGYLKRHLNVFWVADYRDLWHGSHLVSAKWPFSFFERTIETYFVSQADLITTVSEPLTQRLKQRFNQAVCTIENGFDLEDLPMNHPCFFPKDGKVRLVYTGLIYPGKQDLTPLWEAIQLLRRQDPLVETRLEILFYGPDFSSLTSVLQADQLTGIVKVPGFVSRIEALQIQQSADALIFLDWCDPSVEGILTGKLFEYLFSGRPILGIGATAGSAAGQLLEKTGAGFPLGQNSTELAICLQKLLDGAVLPNQLDRSVLQQYTREVLADKMLECICRAQVKSTG